MLPLHLPQRQLWSKARLLFTDTDRLTYEIKANDVYENFY